MHIYTVIAQVYTLHVLLLPGHPGVAQDLSKAKSIFLPTPGEEGMTMLSDADFSTIIQAFVILILDCCNVLYMGLHLETTWKLKVVQNAVVCLLKEVIPWEWIKSLLSGLL